MPEPFAFQVAEEVPVQQWVADPTAMATDARTWRIALTGCVLVGTFFGDGPVDISTDVASLG